MRKTLQVIVMCMLGLLGILTEANADDKKNVLYLNSYHVGYEWSDDILSGIRTTLTKNPNNRLYVEFLDTKRIHGEEYYNQLFELYNEKYEGIQFDAIITSDNNALDFLLQCYDSTLFKNVPVVFCGVSNVDDYDLPPNFFGVDENSIYTDEFMSILKVFPDINIVYAIIDKTVTGEAFRSQLEFLKEQLSGIVEVEVLDEYDEKNVKNMLDTLRQDGIIYFMAVNVDKQGHVVEPGDVICEIAKYAHVPVYGNPVGEKRTQVFGGVVADGVDHGVASARLAIEILEGRMHRLSTDLVSPEIKFAYNFQELKKWGVTKAQLPEGAIILNEPVAFLKAYQNEIIAIIILILSLVTIIILLSTNIIKRRRMELLVNQQLHEIEQKNSDIWLKNEKLIDLNTRLEDVNIRLIQSNNELIEAKQNAEEANKLKSTFLFNISHEIRTPMNSIIGFLDIVSDDELEKEVKQHYLDIIASNANRLMNNVDNLLEYSRLETGMIELENESYNLKNLLDVSVASAIELAEQKGNKLLVENALEDAKGEVYMDVYKCKRISDIVIETFNRLSEKSSLTLILKGETPDTFSMTFKNKNAGVASENIQTIFRPFVLLEKKNEGKLEDIGLALTIAKYYTIMMKGVISIEPISELGMSVCIELPYYYPTNEVKTKPERIPVLKSI